MDPRYQNSHLWKKKSVSLLFCYERHCTYTHANSMNRNIVPPFSLKLKAALACTHTHTHTIIIILIEHMLKPRGTRCII